jgi:hypothetical protein
LVVADRDFGELIFHQGLAHAGVLFFRLPGAPLPTKLERLSTVLGSHAEALAGGEFLVVTPGQIRVAGYPHPSVLLGREMIESGPSKRRR